jgi:hypothetical protein
MCYNFNEFSWDKIMGFQKVRKFLTDWVSSISLESLRVKFCKSSNECKAKSFLVKFGLFIYFVFFIALIMPQGFDTKLAEREEKFLLPSFTSNQLLDFYGLDDRGHYIVGGRMILEKGFSTAKQDWRMTLWKPGMFVINAFLLSLGENAPVAFFMIVISCLLWAKIFHKTFIICSKYLNLPQFFSFFLPLILLLLSHFRFVVLGDQLFASETYAFSFFFLGTIYFVEYLYRYRASKLLKSGVFFAISTYFRQSSDFIMLCFGLFSLLSLLSIYTLKKSLKVKVSESLSRVINSASVVFVICFSVMSMEKLYNREFLSSGADFLYSYAWLTDEQLGGHDNFVVLGGGNGAACKIAPEVCADFQKRDIFNKRFDQKFMKEIVSTTKETVILHPFEWLYYKIPFLAQYWFNDSPFIADKKIIATNSLLLFLVMAVILMPFFQQSRVNIFCSFLLIVLIVGSLIPILIFHIEPRYLFQIKIAAILLAIITFSDLISRTKLRSSGS